MLMPIVTPTVEKLELIASTTDSSGATISLPAAAKEGHLAVLFDLASSDALPWPTNTIPSGAAQIGDNTAYYYDDPIGYRHQYSVSRKILTATDISNGTLTGMNDDDESKVLFIFSLGKYSVSGDYDKDYQYTGGNPTAQTVTASGNHPCIVFGYSGSRTGNPSLTGSDTFDGEEEAGSAISYTRQRVGYKIMESSSSNFTVDEEDLGLLTCLGSFYIGLT